MAVTVGDFSIEVVFSRAGKMLGFRALCFIILNKKTVLSVCLFSIFFLVKYFPHEISVQPEFFSWSLEPQDSLIPAYLVLHFF